MKGQQSRAFLIPSLDCLAHALAVPTMRCLLSLAADWNLNLVVAFSDFVVRFPICCRDDTDAVFANKSEPRHGDGCSSPWLRNNLFSVAGSTRVICCGTLTPVRAEYPNQLDDSRSCHCPSRGHRQSRTGHGSGAVCEAHWVASVWKVAMSNPAPVSVSSSGWDVVLWPRQPRLYSGHTPRNHTIKE